jgi:hypothetical protein
MQFDHKRREFITLLGGSVVVRQFGSRLTEHH